MFSASRSSASSGWKPHRASCLESRFKSFTLNLRTSRCAAGGRCWSVICHLTAYSLVSSKHNRCCSPGKRPFRLPGLSLSLSVFRYFLLVFEVWLGSLSCCSMKWSHITVRGKVPTVVLKRDHTIRTSIHQTQFIRVITDGEQLKSCLSCSVSQDE